MQEESPLSQPQPEPELPNDPVANYLADLRRKMAEPAAPTPAPLPASPPNIDTLAAGGLSAVRTFQGDLHQTVASEKISAVKIAALEGDRQQPNFAMQSHRRPLILTILGILFALLVIGGGGAVVYYGYLEKNAAGTAQTPGAAPALIVPDQQFGISLAGATRVSLDTQLSSAANTLPITIGQVAEIVFTEPASTSDESTQTAESIMPATFDQVTAAFGWNVPPDLSNNVTNYFFGYIALADSNEPFLLLQIDDYGPSYQAMLGWETSIQNDFSGLFFAETGLTSNPANATIATTSQNLASSSIITTATITPPAFQDLVVSNQNARALVSQNGQTLLLYGFLNNQALLITTDETAFTSIFNRLTTQVTQ